MKGNGSVIFSELSVVVDVPPSDLKPPIDFLASPRDKKD